MSFPPHYPVHYITPEPDFHPWHVDPREYFSPIPIISTSTPSSSQTKPVGELQRSTKTPLLFLGISPRVLIPTHALRRFRFPSVPSGACSHRNRDRPGLHDHGHCYSQHRFSAIIARRA
ncbi:uncharacterized protein K489DRAFT_245357 [Dissoconium aciculare CBS 342.82]|uniref:Uncharacterized protein n=1 Tax=Dissoconium aciculare CBS 342.82 TaxID=1314786 RepID=A0A6J3M3D1_9PEZI|nr:uncharacterized protein K489DRAFT_245357 [Dissoconium aciculare CBS 342.82]KAF1822505.1 hypothetical protein K489DRAFT_245357 [Dissoconium aciculare CBS 342.82]